MKTSIHLLTRLSSLTVALIFSTTLWADETAPAMHRVGAAKLIVDDLKKAQNFYESMFGSHEKKHYDYDLDTYEETIQTFGDGASLALFAPNPKAEKPLPKSRYPQVVIYTKAFDETVKRVEAAGHPLRKLPYTAESKFQIAIATDPSGNRVEIIKADVPRNQVGLSKLIVSDRAKAEAFFQKVFGATSGDRYQTKAYDEVIMNVGEGPRVALFQPLDEEPLPKSRFPLTAIYTSDFDGVVKRLDEEGLGYRKVKTNTPGLQIIIAKDPAGNAIEIIKNR